MQFSVFNIITTLKKKWMDPKVYALVIKTNSGNQFLHVGMYYTLEECLGSCRKAAQLSTEDLADRTAYATAKPFMWTTLSLESLIEPVSDTRMKEVMKVSSDDTNTLMQKIIQKKDRKLLEKNKDSLSAEQYQYLSDELKS